MWTSVLVASVGCYALKLLGLSLPARVLEDRRVQNIAMLLPVAMLGALIATQTFTDGQDITLDARAAGVAVAGLAVWRRAPFLLVVVLACVTTALVRQAA